MTTLQKVVKHDADCSCYALILDDMGNFYDCNICDCGALRKEIKNPSSPPSTELLDSWLNHLTSIHKF